MILSRYQAQPSTERRRKVSIVGFNQAQKPTAPLNDPAYEIWGLNHAHRIGIMLDEEGHLRADRWFDLHQPHAQSKSDLEWIDTCPVPLYLTNVYGVSQLSRAYPLQDIITFFKTDYFCSSFAYMLALAAYEGFEEIRLDGCDLDYGRERLVERGNLEYWIGLLRGQGFTVTLPDSSLLLTHPYRYGFDYSEEKEAVEHMMAANVQECQSYQAVQEILEETSEKVKTLLESIREVRRIHAES